MDARLDIINFNSDVSRSSNLVIRPSSLVIAKPKKRGDHDAHSFLLDRRVIENLSRNPDLDKKITIINPLPNLDSNDYFFYEITGIENTEALKRLTALTSESNTITKGEIVLTLQQWTNFLQEENKEHASLATENILYLTKGEGDGIRLYFLNSPSENFPPRH